MLQNFGCLKKRVAEVGGNLLAESGVHQNNCHANHQCSQASGKNEYFVTETFTGDQCKSRHELVTQLNRQIVEITCRQINCYDLFTQNIMPYM